MLSVMWEKVVRDNFSSSARDYDRYCVVQNLCGLRLISKLKQENPCKILDIGCGSGNYTRLLRYRFPQSRIKAVDISEEMVSISKNKFGAGDVEFICADARALSLQEKFHLITSNMSFQWFADLESFLRRYLSNLEDKGIFLFSLAGSETFFELGQCLKELFSGLKDITAADFWNREKLEEVLPRILRNIEIERRLYVEEFSSVIELFRKIKFSGIRGRGLGRKVFWTRGRMKKLEDIYRKKFGRIVLSYEVFFCKGDK